MKRIATLLLAVLMAVSIVAGLVLPVAADSMYIRKIVSVVYDDSGSMMGDKWAYANYAMQTFCGMLNSEDQLFVTYMSHTQAYSNYDPEKVDLSAGGIQNSVDKIRGHSDSGSTPYKAVQIAYDKLKSVQDSNPNTQYWLVVITDGAFDECGSGSSAKRYLNQEFQKYTDSVMPNGTNPQVTFMGIGGVVMPDQNEKEGIFTFNAKNAGDIVATMASMADRISGRTRLTKSDIKKVDDKTIEISSAIPLLNIAVLAQGTNAKIASANYSNESQIPVSRNINLYYPGYSNLVGGAFLVGDSQKVIGSGTYQITFDRKIDLDEVVILYEPALETRMTITVNGKEISDYSELDQVTEGDTVSVSCKIYEMGTNNEISPDLLPPGTKFEVSVSEDGTVVDKSTGEEMELKDYVLKQKDTQIKASVMIEGFNPIDFVVMFTPQKYVPKVVYTIVPSFADDVKSVKLDLISANKDMAIHFTVLADGVPMTDSNAVKALNPVITVSPQGNSGAITYSADGKIIFTPNAALMPASGVESFDVDVTCAIDDGTSVTETYTVLISDYQVIPTDAASPVIKTQFFGNRTGVSFRITKDGVQLDKAAVEQKISVLLNEAHSGLNTEVTVDPDGTVRVIPYSDKDYKLSFFYWFVHWYDYLFRITGEDVVVTLSHAYGNADAKIDVTEQSVGYILLNVVLPLALEVAAVAFLIWWICCILFKPKFPEGASLYVGFIKYKGEEGNRYHEISKMEEVMLEQYNTLAYRWKPTMKAMPIPMDKDLVISAGTGGMLLCHCSIYFSGRIKPKDPTMGNIAHPDAIGRYIQRNRTPLEVDTLEMMDAKRVKIITTINAPNNRTFYVYPTTIRKVDGSEAIGRGTFFAYAYRNN